MKTISDLFSHEWAYALGWTLLHSLWQSLAILLTVVACLRLIPIIFSKARYAVACTGFFVTIIATLFTFTYLISQKISADFSIQAGANNGIEVFKIMHAPKPSVEHLLREITNTVDSKMHWIILAWALGFTIFSVRLISGFFFTYKLRSSAIPLSNEWGEYLQSLSERLGIKRLIHLAESSEINSPMVMGYFKPVILIPVGMVTGLTASQLEAIFYHELAHIKRNDFLINFLQSLIETLLFFNPFIWSLSSLIRREREYCCDDVVVHQHGSPLAYAHALTHLAEVRLSKNEFALSLAENKNQLLKRIKRIMEGSAKRYSIKERMIIPAILIIAGLSCASWLSIQPDKNYVTSVQDTVIKENMIYRFGDPQEELAPPLISELDRPFLPGDSMTTPSMVLPPTAPLMPSFYFKALPDTFPGPQFHFRQNGSWEELSKAFEQKFSEKFQDFYSPNHNELSKMMQELQEKFQSEDWPEMAMSFEDLASAEEGFQQALLAHQEAIKNLEEFEDQDVFKGLQEKMRSIQEVEMEKIQNLELELKIQNENFKTYDQVLREQLLEDGYLSENEPIRSMEWNDESFKINGNPIKESDKSKHKEFQEKYMGGKNHFEKVE